MDDIHELMKAVEELADALPALIVTEVDPVTSASREAREYGKSDEYRRVVAATEPDLRDPGRGAGVAGGVPRDRRGVAATSDRRTRTAT